MPAFFRRSTSCCKPLVPAAQAQVTASSDMNFAQGEPSDAPGIGVELDEAEIAKHPYGQTNFLRLFEEGWERRGR